MGTCTSRKNSYPQEKCQKQMIKQIRADIDRLKEFQQYHQALIKMAKLISLLMDEQESGYHQELMEIYIEMGRINQDVASNHQNAYYCFQKAIEMSVCIYGSKNNQVANQIIQPFLQMSHSVIVKAQTPHKQTASFFSVNNSSFSTFISTSSQCRNNSKRTSTYTSAQPPSLNIIMEESSPHHKQNLQKQDMNLKENQIVEQQQKEEEDDDDEAFLNNVDEKVIIKQIQFTYNRLTISKINQMLIKA